MWTKCESNGVSKAGRRKVRKATKKKQIWQKLTAKPKIKEKVAEEERMEKARRKRLIPAIIVE